MSTTLVTRRPLPRKTGAAKDGGQRGSSIKTSNADVPPLPPRPVDLLSDGEEMELKGWDVLKPS
jgi:hypothetical protein